MGAPFVRSAYNYDMDKASDEAGLDCRKVPKGEERDRTKQGFKDEVDINTIVRRFGLTGQLPDVVAVPQFVDFENVIDFHTAMIAVRGAQEKFDALPGELRSRFQNDPNELMYFLGDEKNRDEAVKLGLVKAPPPPPPPPPAVPEATRGGAAGSVSSSSSSSSTGS